MLFLQVENNINGPQAKPSEAKSKIYGDLRASYIENGLYTFCHAFDQGILLGECESRFSDKIAVELLESIHNPQKVLMSSGRHIFDLAYINHKKSELIMSLSISSCRPVYYYSDRRRWIISTHIKKIEESGVQLSLEDNVLPEFNVYRHVVPPRTLYSGIKKLRGGETLQIDLNSNHVVRRTSWKLHDGRRAGDKANNRIKRIEDILKDDLEELFKSHKKPEVLLSGGLDSTTLASISKELKNDVSSCSSSFSFLNKDDKEDDYALSAAKEVKIDHTAYPATAETYLSGLVHAIRAAEEPVHHLQSVLLYLIYQRLKSHESDLIICGEGADAIFGNDAHVRVFKYASLLKSARALGIQQLFGKIVGRSLEKNSRYGFFAYDFGKNLETHRHYLWTLGQFADIDLVKSNFGTSLEKILAGRMTLMENYSGSSLLDMITIISMLSEAHISMNIWGKLAEANNMAIVYPYMNPAVVQLVMSLPWRFKLKESKYVIRALLRRGKISEEIIRRPKQSFGFPPAHWALPNKLLQPIVDMASEMYDSALLSSLQSGEIKRAMLLWNLVNIYLWHSLFIKKVSAHDLSGEILDRYRKMQTNNVNLSFMRE